MKMLRSELFTKLRNNLCILQCKNGDPASEVKLLKQVVNGIIDHYIPKSLYINDKKI